MTFVKTDIHDVVTNYLSGQLLQSHMSMNYMICLVFASSECGM